MSGRRSRSDDANTEQLRSELVDVAARERLFIRLSRLERRLGVAAIVILLVLAVASFGLQWAMLGRTGRQVEEAARQSRQNELLLRQLDTDARDRDRSQERGAEAVAELVRVVQEGNEQSRANSDTLRTLGSRPEPTTVVVIIEPGGTSPPDPAPTASPRPSPQESPTPKPGPGPSPSPSPSPFPDVDDLVCGLTGECAESASVLDVLPMNGGT